MDRALLRLNMLLEATAAWGRSASFEALLADLPRIKWVLAFDRCTLHVSGTAQTGARAFAVTATGAAELDPDALAGPDALTLRSTLTDGQPRIDRDESGHRLGYPLESGSRLIGAICFSAGETRYEYRDLRFAQFIAQALAGIVDRLVAREDERRLGASEERYRSLVSVITDVPWSADATGAFVTPQAAWSAFTGQTQQELSGFGWAQAIHPDDRERVQAAWEEARASRAIYESHGRLWHAASQQYRYFVARAVPLLHCTGMVREWVGTCTDVHDRKCAEEALREADRRKDEFLATLAHELRNPLAPIRTGLQLIRLAGDTPGSVERVRSMMERQVGHMVRLIDDLLDVSRIASGRIHLQRRPTPLAEIVHGAVEANRAFIEAGGLQLTVDLPDEACVLDVDPTRFVQIVSNLLHNAAKFTEAPGRIHVSAEIVHGYTGAERELALTVSDTGVGISPELLPRVFELFTQGERTTQRSHGGLGIGLALAQQLVHLHGGRIQAESTGTGQGSRFSITLPLGRTALPSVPSAPPDAWRGVKRRVVIVDDNRDAAEALANLVHALGGEARTAADGEAGLRCVVEFRPEIVLLDIGMPGMDGHETCRRIRALSLAHPMFIVALTGWGQEQDRQRAMDAGFDAHLTKPADPATLERLLADVSTPDGALH